MQIPESSSFAVKDSCFLESLSFVVKDKSVKHLKYSKKIYATRHSELSISDSYLLFSTKAHERIACSTHSSTVDAESSFTLTYLLFRSLALYPSNFTIKVADSF
uniref:Uncharacterized protein n=1 Tax=Rhizophagus irregularis (strain DAOM 181602 / DAOM 197198 / MUCL 43194) TaxID=747089 RepID=U9TU01_RHIID